MKTTNKQVRPCSHIFYSTEKKSFAVFPMGMRWGGHTLLDGPIEIDAVEFESRIPVVLTKALDSFQDTAPPDRVWRPPALTAFIREHQCVSVTRLESGDLDVHPLHHQNGGYTGKEGEHIIVPAADVPARIASVLKDAFSAGGPPGHASPLRPGRGKFQCFCI